MKNRQLTLIMKALKCLFGTTGLKMLFFIAFIGLWQVSAMSANSLEIRGVVTDASGQTLPGVNVVVKGTTLGVTTDINGEYVLTVPADAQVLVFSFVGMQTQEVEIRGRTLINVTMQEGAIGLDEFQVVGYGWQRRESVVGAITTIDVQQLQVPSRSISNALAGRMAGVISVQTTGEPGFDHAQFWIRGVGTFGANRDPLILVDGIERDINGLDIEEVESISILKDATATAVYGVRGANGVVLITTKRGTQDRPTVSFRTETGMTSPTRMPRFVDAVQFSELFNEARGMDFYSQEVIDAYRNHSDPDLFPNVNWLDEMYSGSAGFHRHNLNVRGGTERVRYFMSGSFYNEDGMYAVNELARYNSNINLQRYNFRSNIDISLTETTELSLGIGDVLTSRNTPGATSGNIWGYAFATSPNVFPAEYSDGRASGPSWGTGENPYNLLVNSGYSDIWENTVQSIVALKQEMDAVTEGLSGRIMFSFDKYNTSTMTRFKEVETFLAVNRDEDGELVFNRTREGQEFLTYNSSSSANRRIYFETALTYDRRFGVHTLGGLLLYNQSSFMNTGAVSFETALPYVHQGIAGRATYSFRDRYFLEGNFGYNGSENFAKGHRFGFFPSVAVGWIPSNETFFEGVKETVTWLKLRGSHGYVGNDEIGGGRRFIYLSTVDEGASGYNFGTNNAWHTGITFGEIGTPLATWEKAQMSNLGLEFHLFHDLQIQADVFYEKRDMIFLQRGSLPGFIGLQTPPFVNLGVMENKGFDGSMEYLRRFGEFSISFMGNFSYARNKILENDQPDYTWAYRNRHGQKFGQQFGFIAVGLFESEEEIAQSPTQFGLTNLRPGDIKYLDVNGDGVIDSNDEVPIGFSTIPEIVYGFGASMVYKNFDFSFMFQGVSNVSRMIGGVPVFPFNSPNLGRSNIYEEVYYSRWTEDNPSQDVMFPRLSDGPNDNNFRPSTWWQQDMSYMRLRNIELGFTLSQDLTRRARIENMRFFVSGMNLLTFSGFKLWDPELGTNNGNVYPLSKVVNFGASINF
jgi:TonB-linked SusC/RagA family outer membrane protein